MMEMFTLSQGKWQLKKKKERKRQSQLHGLVREVFKMPIGRKINFKK